MLSKRFHIRYSIQYIDFIPQLPYIDLSAQCCIMITIMSQTVTVSSKTIEQILARLDRLTKEVKTIKAKLFEESPYGSDAWWKWSDKKALEEIRQGKGMTKD